RSVTPRQALDSLFGKLHALRGAFGGWRRRQGRKGRRPYRPEGEALEPRIVPSFNTEVWSTDDDATSTTEGSSLIGVNVTFTSNVVIDATMTPVGAAGTVTAFDYNPDYPDGRFAEDSTYGSSRVLF